MHLSIGFGIPAMRGGYGDARGTAGSLISLPRRVPFVKTVSFASDPARHAPAKHTSSRGWESVGAVTEPTVPQGRPPKKTKKCLGNPARTVTV